MSLPSPTEFRDRTKTNAQMREMLAQVAENAFGKNIVSEAPDLNTYETDGFYYARSNAVAAASINSPTTVPFVLEVYKTHSDGYSVMQEVHDVNNNSYHRSGLRTTPTGIITWTTWQKIATDDGVNSSISLKINEKTVEKRIVSEQFDANAIRGNIDLCNISHTIALSSTNLPTGLTPTTAAGTLITRLIGNSGDYAVQFYLTGQELYFRNLNSTVSPTSEANKWHQVAKKTDIPANKFNSPTVVSTAPDLNTYENDGIYYVRSNGIAAASINSPTTVPFALKVYKTHSDGYSVMQEVHDVNNNSYHRSGLRTTPTDSITWTTWQKIATESTVSALRNELNILKDNVGSLKSNQISTIETFDYLYLESGKLKAVRADTDSFVCDISPRQFLSLDNNGACALAVTDLVTRISKTPVALNCYKNTYFYSAPNLLTVIPSYGQSNAIGATGSVGNVDRTEIMTDDITFASSLLMFKNKDIRLDYNQTENNTVDGATLTDFAPMKTIQNSLKQVATVTEGACRKLAIDCAKNLGFRPKILTWTSAKGGTGLSGLTVGTVPYTNLITGLTRAVAIANSKGLKVFVPAINWVHGENDANSSTYKSSLVAFYSQLNADIKAITGQLADVKMIMSQPISWSGEAYKSSLAMLELSNEDENFILVNAPYTLPINPDFTHLTDTGHYKNGEYFGKALNLNVIGKKFKPTQIESVVKINNNTLEVNFYTPVGSLTVDTTVTAKDENWGLTVHNSSGVKLTITNKVKNGNKITLTVSESLTAGYVGYGLIGHENPYPTFVEAGKPRGQLRDQDAIPSIVDGMPLYNWCVYSKSSF